MTRRLSRMIKLCLRSMSWILRYLNSGWTQTATLEGSVQGVVVHAKRLVSGSDFRGNETTTTKSVHIPKELEGTRRIRNILVILSRLKVTERSSAPGRIRHDFEPAIHQIL